MDILINPQHSTLPSQLSLLDLNDYCLLELMSHLPLSDLIFMSTICTRLEYNAQRLFPERLKLWKDFSDNDNATVKEFLLSKIGRFLSEVEVCDDTAASVEATLASIKMNCEYLEKIHLNHSVPKDLMNLPSNIKSISIDFPENWLPTTDYLETLNSFNELESLTLKFNSFTQIDSGFLARLPPLKELRLKNCSVDTMNLQRCLENSTTKLEALSLSKCFPDFPYILTESINQMVQLKQLEFQFNCGRTEFIPLNILKRLTSLKLTNSSCTSVDVDKLFGTLIECNQIETLSMNSIDNNKALNRTTLQQLHHLTNLRRLSLQETDFATDDLLMEISKSNLSHFMYKQTYRPMLSFDAFMAFVALQSSKLRECCYVVYHDVSEMNRNTEHKIRLLDAFKKTASFERIAECKSTISNQLTSVEFSFKK